IGVSAGARGGAAVPAAAPPRAPADTPITSTAELVRRMHDRYAGKWYRTLSFTQNNTLYRSGGGEDRSQWLEYMAVPGRLRIEYMPRESKSGVLFENDRVHAFNAGKLLQTQRRVHPLLLMSADVYAIPADTTVRRLDSLGVDTGKFRVDTLDGRRVYVVGAAAGDSTAPQVWVDADRLLTRRLIEQQSLGARTVVTDARFNGYADFEGVPVATEMLFLRDGRPVFKEEYTDVKVNVPLSDELFDPGKWSDAKP
ncbi:MAG: hypothetical protein ACJ79S_02355, partial [Gemmatimonadaceae bacterium]